MRKGTWSVHKHTGKITTAITEGENNNCKNKHKTNTILPLWKIRSSQKKKKKKHWQDFQKRSKEKKWRRALFLEFGRKHFSLQQETAGFSASSPALLTLSSLSDKLLAPLSPWMGRFLDWEAQSRCLMNWGDLADVWPFPGPLRTDGLFSFTTSVIYSATALSSFPHTAIGPDAVPTALTGENSLGCYCFIIIIGFAGSLPPAEKGSMQRP